MKVMILAGGLGTRLSEETSNKPKPMVEVGGRPILWHIMKIYASYGYNEFVIALGYKSDAIKKYFLEYASICGNLTVNISNGKVEIAQREQEEWVIHLEETGLHTNTGGRVNKLKEWVNNEPFMLTYGDGVGDISIDKLIKYHNACGKLATVTAVRPPARFGALDIDDEGIITRFSEKPQAREGWINGGFLVLQPDIFDYIEDKNTSLESGLLETLATHNQLAAYRHQGFWQCMDNLRDLKQLQNLWDTDNAPWKIWA